LHDTDSNNQDSSHTNALSIFLIGLVVFVYGKLLFTPFLTAGILALNARAVSLTGYMGQACKLLPAVFASSFHFDPPNLYSLGKTKCNVHTFLKIRQEDGPKRWVDPDEQC
jgi:hypothetical protein